MDPRDFADIVQADRRALVRAAARLLGPAEAEDAVQDAYLRAWEAEALSLKAAQAWLLTVVRRLAIDRLRRRQWMAQWLDEAASDNGVAREAPSAEADAALQQAVTRALSRLATRLSPVDGAALLLHEVFDIGHAEIAEATGRSEAASRQRLRRAWERLRANGERGEGGEAGDGTEDPVLRAYLLALRGHDPRILWAMLREPPIRASAEGAPAAPVAPAAAPSTACGIVQAGGRLALVLTLDGVTLCVVPLGVHRELEPG